MCAANAMLYMYFQDVTFVFKPTAQTVNPSDLTFTVKYSMKDVDEITDNMLKNNYTIEVQALRSHSNTVSEAIGEKISLEACYFPMFIKLAISNSKFQILDKTIACVLTNSIVIVIAHTLEPEKMHMCSSTTRLILINA